MHASALHPLYSYFSFSYLAKLGYSILLLTPWDRDRGLFYIRLGAARVKLMLNLPMSSRFRVQGWGSEGRGKAKSLWWGRREIEERNTWGFER